MFYRHIVTDQTNTIHSRQTAVAGFLKIAVYNYSCCSSKQTMPEYRCHGYTLILFSNGNYNSRTNPKLDQNPEFHITNPKAL